ncbi:MAG: hypothetical protein N2Z21_05655 [Candidatus Sumerlaeaceae bacterium]|nr:hypothetical protein [Candidatus Sumerlaeaceae bacterium]
MKRGTPCTVLALVAGGLLISGCASVTSQGSGGLTRVFVPPPPLGASSSTITVVPAKRGGAKTPEKSWGTTETSGGSAYNPSQKDQPQAAANVEHQGISSLYDVSASPSGRSVEQPVKRSASKPLPQEKPVPVLYEKKKERQPAGPSREDLPGESDFDPRLAS